MGKKKDYRVQVVLDLNQRAELEAAAKEKGMALSTWMRSLALDTARQIQLDKASRAQATVGL